jgi:hypothetical protein
MRSRIVFTGRLRFAEINTHDLPASMRSSNRRSSSGVQFVPRCCTAIRIRSFLRLRYRRRLSVIFLRSIFSLMARERTACSVRFNCIPISRAFTSDRARIHKFGWGEADCFPPATFGHSCLFADIEIKYLPLLLLGASGDLPLDRAQYGGSVWILESQPLASRWITHSGNHDALL